MIAFRINEWRKAVDFKAVAIVQVCAVKPFKTVLYSAKKDSCADSKYKSITFPKWAHACPSTIGITF